MTKVSVCMATYNGEKHLSRQLNSVLNQLKENDEIVISDDFSTDTTEQVVNSICDHRIKFYKNKGTKGPVGNFEYALNQATGDIIFLCDQDDVWLPNKVDVMVNLLNHYDLVLSDCIVVNKNLEVIYPSFFVYRNSKIGILSNLYKNSYIGCCMAFRKEVLSYVLPFPKNVYMHDWWIGLIVELRGRVYFYELPLIKYVRHGNNASPTGEGSLGWAARISNRLGLVVSLLVRLIS